MYGKLIDDQLKMVVSTSMFISVLSKHSNTMKMDDFVLKPQTHKDKETWSGGNTKEKWKDGKLTDECELVQQSSEANTSAGSEGK